jgi:hypothetical protein
MSDAASIVSELDQHTTIADFGSYGQDLVVLFSQGTNAVRREIQKDLYQVLPICPNDREIRRNIPSARDSRLSKRRRHYDPDIVQD